MNTATATRETITTTIRENDIHAFQRMVAKAGGHIVRSCFSGGGYTVTYVI